MKQLARTTCALAVALALGLNSQASGSDTTQSLSEPAGPHEAEGLLKLGKDLTDRGDYASAEIAYRQVLDRPGFTTPDQETALLGLARSYRKSGEGSKAAAVFEKFINDFPTDDRIPDALLELGRTLRTMGADKLALNRFYSVIDTTLKLTQPGFDHYQSLARTAEYEIAETYYETGDYVQAGKYFGRLQLLDMAAPDRARASFMSAHSKILAGDIEGGCKALQAFVEAWPKDSNVPEARYLLATGLRRLKHPQEALAVVLDLLREERNLDSADPQAWAYWQRRTGNLLANDFFQSGDSLSALAIYQSMINLSAEPEWQIPIQYQVALCNERLYDYANAANAYQRVVDGAAAAKPAPTPEIAELAQMSAWRLNHIEWLQKTDSKLASYTGVADRKAAAAADTPTKTSSNTP